MGKWLEGFSMAWGMFLAIPNPLPRWNEKARGQMLTCLPLVGLLVGGLWALCFWLLSRWTNPAVRLLLAVFPWLLTGFIHLDGYMDVCDAILSRRDLATRQKILKDSHCGAFAVICIVLLALGQWSLFLSAGEDRSLLGLCCIPAAVRCCAGLAVGKLRPMGTSQYAAMRHLSSGLTAALCLLLGLFTVLPIGISFSFGPLAAAAGYVLAAAYGYRQLDGMSGDISGFALTLGELAGVTVWALGR